jgi:hypothetical protein
LADASGHCTCRLSLSRAEERLGVAGAKSLLNLVEMKSDFPGGHSQAIRTTCRKTEHFSERKFFHECGLCAFAGEKATHALCLGGCSLAPQRGEGESRSAHTIYDQVGFSDREHVHPIIFGKRELFGVIAISAVPLEMPVKRQFVTLLKARGSAAFIHGAEDLVVFSPRLYK